MPSRADPHVPNHQNVDRTAHSPVLPDAARSTAGAGLSIRRWFLVASPVLAGLFAVLGAACDPAVGQDGPVLWEAYAENPEPLQLKSFGLHWAYAFWLVPTLLIAGLVRDRGVWIANVAAFLGFVGISTLPGLPCRSPPSPPGAPASSAGGVQPPSWPGTSRSPSRASPCGARRSPPPASPCSPTS